MCHFFTLGYRVVSVSSVDGAGLLALRLNASSFEPAQVGKTSNRLSSDEGTPSLRPECAAGPTASVNNQELPATGMRNMLLSSDSVPINEKRICHPV